MLQKPSNNAADEVDVDSRPLRVLFVLSGVHRIRRGAETAFESIAHHLAQKAGTEVTLIGSGPPNDQCAYRYRRARSFRRENFERWPKLPLVRNEGMYEELTFVPGLASIYRLKEFDVTVACTYPYTNWMLRRGRSRRPPHVFVTQNGDWPAQSDRSEFKYFGCDGLVCTNIEYYERNRHQWFSELIPNGVDPSLFKPGPVERHRLNLPDDKPVVLMVSSLVETKRVGAGIEALAEMADVYLLIVGDGPLRKPVKLLCEAKLDGRYDIRSVDRRQMPDLYRAADVFLHMSQVEPSANAYMEALASGLPIVTHDRDVTRWTFEEQAILVDTSDPFEVRDGVRKALSMRSVDAVVQRRALVDRRFSWSTIADQYHAFFKKVIEHVG